MERRGPGVWFWLLVTGVTFVVGTRLFREEPAEAPVPDAGSAPAPAPPPAAYALDTTRSNWPPLEDGAPTEAAHVEPAAVSYYLVLDGSGSMTKEVCSAGRTKIEAAIAAVTAFVQSVPDDQYLGLAVFDRQGLSERVPLAQHNRVRMAEALARVDANGGTPLQSALSLGFEQLTRQARRQLGYGEYHLVVVTDGHPAPESEDPTRAVNRILNESPVLLHTIGFCIGTQHVLNQPGRVFYAAADNPEQLRQGLDAVLAESPTFDVSRFGP